MIDVPGILLLYHEPPVTRAATTREHLNSYGAYSDFPVFAVNTDLDFPRRLLEFRFQVVVLHISILYPRHYHLSGEFLDYLDLHRERYRVAFFQDEHHYCQYRFAFLNEHGIDSVFTLLAPEQVPAVYGRYTTVPNVVSVLPGYVTEEMESFAHRPAKRDSERTVDVGYRGTKLPAYMGRGSQEKYEIAFEFRHRAEGIGLNLDIEADASKRIYGAKWFGFIENCRAVLGVESGVSVFDLEDKVRLEYERLVAEKPDLTFEEVSAALLEPHEDLIPYRTISPRHFEAAALGTCQILFEGEYSGIMRPLEHYIPLRKDYANFDEVVAMFRDVGLRTDLVARTRRDLIESGAYTYRRFIETVDSELRGAGLKPNDQFDRSIVDDALAEGEAARRLRRHLRQVRHKQFRGRNLLKPILKPFVDRYL